MKGCGNHRLQRLKSCRICLAPRVPGEALRPAGILTAQQAVVGFGHIVLALLFEAHHLHFMFPAKGLDRLDEPVADRSQHRAGGEGVARVPFDETGHKLRRLQPRDVKIEVHPVDPFELECHMFVLEFGDIVTYFHGGSGCGLRRYYSRSLAFLEGLHYGATRLPTLNPQAHPDSGHGSRALPKAPNPSRAGPRGPEAHFTNEAVPQYASNSTPRTSTSPPT